MQKELYYMSNQIDTSPNSTSESEHLFLYQFISKIIQNWAWFEAPELTNQLEPVGQCQIF